MASITYLTFAPISMKEGRLHSDIASLRYRVILPMAHLARRGHRFNVNCIPPNAKGPIAASLAPGDIVVFSKSATLLNEDLARKLKTLGKKVVVDVCDNYFGHLTLGDSLREHQVRMCRLADVVVTSTPELALLIREHTGADAVVVSDPVEGPRGTPRFAPNGQCLKALWFGHHSNVGGLAGLMPVLARVGERLPVELTVMTRISPAFRESAAATNREHAPRLRVRLDEWRPGSVWPALQRCDLVVIPSPVGQFHAVKSPNRMAESLWGGRMVVAHPLPAYEPFRPFAWIGDDIASGIHALLEEPWSALPRISAGQAYVAASHAPAVIADAWEEALGIKAVPAP